MWRGLCNLFVIKTKFEAFLVIYGLGMGAVERGLHYVQQYPGYGGWLLFAVCPIAVFMAGARILDSVERSRE
jgi:hypothetical protein